MTNQATTTKQRAGVLTIHLFGPQATYKAQFQPLKDKSTDPPPRHETQEFTDYGSLEAYLRPFMPYVPDEGSAKDLAAKIKTAGSITLYICCSPMELRITETQRGRGRTPHVAKLLE